MSKAAFRNSFPGVISSRSYQLRGLYNYKTIPSKAMRFKIDAESIFVKKRARYALPESIKGACDEALYRRWLHRKAVAHAIRDRKRWNIPLAISDYKKAIHAAVAAGGSHDAYTGEPLNWSLISQYNNLKSKNGRTKYKKGFKDLPTLDHASDIPGDMNFKICSWRTNAAKSDLTITELIEFCHKITHHNKKHAR